MMFRILFFFLPFPFLAVCLVMIALNGIFGKIDPEEIDRQTFVRVIQFRDFRQFSPEFVKRLTDRAEQEFGRHSPNKPTFEFSLLEKKVHVYFQTHRLSQQSPLEINLTLMARIRYFQWMYEYPAATPVRKAELMNDVVEDMRYWQEIYFDYIRSLGQPEPTLLELYQDFQQMIEDFKRGASPEEVELIDSFAQEMSRTMFATEMQKTIWDLLSPLK